MPVISNRPFQYLQPENRSLEAEEKSLLRNKKVPAARKEDHVARTEVPGTAKIAECWAPTHLVFIPPLPGNSVPKQIWSFCKSVKWSLSMQYGLCPRVSQIQFLGQLRISSRFSETTNNKHSNINQIITFASLTSIVISIWSKYLSLIPNTYYLTNLKKIPHTGNKASLDWCG